MRYKETMDNVKNLDNVKTFTIHYVTPRGKHGRKDVPAKKLARVCCELEEKGYYDLRVSYYPV
jgi:hypothetical protein